VAVRNSPWYISITQGSIDYFGGATSSFCYLRSGCAILVAIDDFLVAQSQPFTSAGASFAALSNWLSRRTNDDKHSSSIASRGNPNCFRIATLAVKFYNFHVAERASASSVIRHSST
jgi:hypothetical protein